jgi:hypothetical protein
MSASLTKTQIWGAPVTLGVVSAFGLVSALLADGVWDVLSWLVLAVPVAVSAWGIVAATAAGTGQMNATTRNARRSGFVNQRRRKEGGQH